VCYEPSSIAWRDASRSVLWSFCAESTMPAASRPIDFGASIAVSWSDFEPCRMAVVATSTLRSAPGRANGSPALWSCGRSRANRPSWRLSGCWGCGEVPGTSSGAGARWTEEGAAWTDEISARAPERAAWTDEGALRTEDCAGRTVEGAGCALLFFVRTEQWALWPIDFFARALERAAASALGDGTAHWRAGPPPWSSAPALSRYGTVPARAEPPLLRAHTPPWRSLREFARARPRPKRAAPAPLKRISAPWRRRDPQEGTPPERAALERRSWTPGLDEIALEGEVIGVERHDHAGAVGADDGHFLLGDRRVALDDDREDLGLDVRSWVSSRSFTLRSRTERRSRLRPYG
jgi:hypothetical protein